MFRKVILLDFGVFTFLLKEARWDFLNVQIFKFVKKIKYFRGMLTYTLIYMACRPLIIHKDCETPWPRSTNKLAIPSWVTSSNMFLVNEHEEKYESHIFTIHKCL